MTWTIAAGSACGLATLVISEATLRIGCSSLQRGLFRALAVGAALRTVWVLAVLAWALSNGISDPRAFVLALLTGYLAAQVFEGVRYGRYFERC